MLLPELDKGANFVHYNPNNNLHGVIDEFNNVFQKGIECRPR
jgi:hypothetical protein